MLAAIADKDTLHIIQWTGRVRLHAGARTYCGMEGDAAVGVLQVPDEVLSKGSEVTLENTKLKPCSRCRIAVQSAVK